MAVKDQCLCYRTIKGVRWPNLCDVMDDNQQDEIDKRRAAGHRIAVRKHPDGYHQAFIHPEDLTKDWEQE